MAGLDEVGAVIREVGPRDPDVAGVLETAPGEWLVRYDDLDVGLEYDGEADHLALTAALGAPPRGQEASVHTTLLTYNSLWRQTGGVQMALEADGTAVQLLVLSGREVTVELLSAVLPNFATKARLMRAFVATPAAPMPQADTLSAHAMRV